MEAQIRRSLNLIDGELKPAPSTPFTLHPSIKSYSLGEEGICVSDFTNPYGAQRQKTPLPLLLPNKAPANSMSACSPEASEGVVGHDEVLSTCLSAPPSECRTGQEPKICVLLWSESCGLAWEPAR